MNMDIYQHRCIDTADIHRDGIDIAMYKIKMTQTYNINKKTGYIDVDNVQVDI